MKSETKTAAHVEAVTITAAELLTTCERCASIAVNRNHSASGNKMLTGVQNDKTADRRTEATADQLSKAATMRAKAAKLKDEAKEHRRNARTSPDKLITQAAARGEAMTWEAAEAYKDSQTAEAERKAREAATLLREAKRTEDSARTGHTFGDFQPLKHDAIVGHLTAQYVYQYIVTPADIITAADKATEAAERHKNPTPWHALNAARSAAAIITSRPEYLFMEAWRHVAERMATKATHAAITAQLHHDVNKTTKERKTIATPAILEAWRQTHGENSGKAYKVYVGRDEVNYYTMEYREYKTEATGWYLVYHVKTVSPIVSLDAYAENSHRAEAEAAEHGTEALKAARAEAEEVTPEIVTNGGIPMAGDQDARERLQAAILDNPNFTKRERDFTTYFLSTKAAKAGQAAVNEAIATKERAKTAKAAEKAAKRTAAVQKTPKARAAAKAAEATAKAAAKEAAKVKNDLDAIRYDGMIQAAADHIGIETRSQLDNFTSRWRARAAEAVKVEQGCPTPEEAAEAEAKQWERMQKNSHRNTRPGEAATVLFVGIDTPEAIEKAAAKLEKAARAAEAKAARDEGNKQLKARAKKARAKADKAREAVEVVLQTSKNQGQTAAQAITWTESRHKPQTMTPEEVEAMTARERAAQAAYINAHAADIARLDYRRQFTQYRQSRTAYAAHDAQAAALVFWDAMTPEEQTAHIEAERARKAKYTRLRAAAHATGVYSLNSTFEQWKAWSEEERAEHMRFVANFNK